MVEKCPYSENFLNKDKYKEDFLKENDSSINNFGKLLNNINTDQQKDVDVLSVNSTKKSAKVDNSDNESLNMSTQNTQRSKCPYNKEDKASNSKNMQDNISKHGMEKIDVNQEKVIERINKCPYTGKILSKEKVEEKKAEEKKDEKNEDENSDDEQQQGGCPVMNNKKNDPRNKHYTESWNLPFYGPFDFMFELRGILNQQEFLEKTKELRSYNRHLLYTLFNQNDEKLNQVRAKEFPMVFFIYDDIKIKGNKLFKKGKFKESLEYYFYVIF